MLLWSVTPVPLLRPFVKKFSVSNSLVQSSRYSFDLYFKWAIIKENIEVMLKSLFDGEKITANFKVWIVEWIWITESLYRNGNGVKTFGSVQNGKCLDLNLKK